MNIMSGIRQLRGFPAEIPNCGRADLPAFLIEMGYKVGAEIGVLAGEFTEVLCQAGFKMYGIDPWLKKYGTYRRHPMEDMEATYREACERLSQYDCTLIRKYSRDALVDFKDESLDFVFIDGNHSLPYVVGDIWNWNLKVRRGGVVAGHDYVTLVNAPYSSQACHVKDAVDVCAKVLGVKDYYILGEFRPKHGHRDRHRCWLWVKP